MKIKAGVHIGVRYLLTVVLGCVCLAGCKGREKSVEMGPVETVETFCKATAAGQWDEAEALCDTENMKEYIMNLKQAWEQNRKKDEGATKVARSIMEGTTVTVNGTQKDENRRVVTYTLETDGLSKTKKAVLEKEEGAWRVSRVTEVN